MVPADTCTSDVNTNETSLPADNDLVIIDLDGADVTVTPVKQPAKLGEVITTFVDVNDDVM